jgi:hypothetical protein
MSSGCVPGEGEKSKCHGYNSDNYGATHSDEAYAACAQNHTYSRPNWLGTDLGDEVPQRKEDWTYGPQGEAFPFDWWHREGEAWSQFGIVG